MTRPFSCLTPLMLSKDHTSKWSPARHVPAPIKGLNERMGYEAYERFKQMKSFFAAFKSSEDGAVTVDWVVLTAAVMLLGVAIGAAISTSVSTANDNVGESLANATSSSTP